MYPDRSYADRGPEPEPVMDETTSVEHAIVYATAMLTQMERAMTDVRQYRSTKNATATAAALAVATHCHRVATSWVLSASWIIADNPAHAPLKKACDHLHQQAQQSGEDIEHQMLQAADIMNDDDCHEQTIRWYVNRMQAVHTLAAFRYIQAMLGADHANDDTWNEAYRSACIETMEQMAERPEMEPMDEAEARAAQIRPDGFTDAKRELQQAHEDARRQMADLCRRAVQAYSESIPLVASPAMQRFPNLCQAAAEKEVSSLQVHPGLFCSRQAINDILKKAFDGMSELPVEITPFETDPTEDEGYVAYVIYIHQGQKHIQAIEDPYPKGFPADQAVEHMEAALEYLEQQEDDYGNAHPALEWCGFREVIRARMDAAMLDLHDVSREDLLSVIETGKRLRLPHGARIAMIDAATCWEPSVVELILKGTQHANPKLATKQQASQIVQAARQAGLDDYKLAELAEMLGYQASEIGVTKPTVPDRTLARLERAAQAAGLPRESIESMLYALEQ